MWRSEDCKNIHRLVASKVEMWRSEDCKNIHRLVASKVKMWRSEDSIKIYMAKDTTARWLSININI